MTALELAATHTEARCLRAQLQQSRGGVASVALMLGRTLTIGRTPTGLTARVYLDVLGQLTREHDALAAELRGVEALLEQAVAEALA